MNYKVEKKGKYAIITMQTPRLDVQSAAELRSELVLLSGESVKHIVIDLMQCEYCDTAGLSAILIANRLCQDGMLILSSVPQNVESMLQIQRFNPELVLVANDENTEDVELGWFKASDLQKNIAEPAFNGKKGEKFTVASGMGEQTFKIADKGNPTPKVKLAILSRKVTPSSKTYGILYNEAKQFIVNNNSIDSLRQSAQELGLSVTPAFALDANADKVNDLKNSRPIVRWAYEATVGDLSDVFECGNQFVVAALTEINDGEYRTLNEVRAELQMQALADKKADYIINQLNGVTTLEAAAELFDAEIQSAEGISLASYRLGAAGVEPAVIGAALALESNTTSAPVKGNMGVYMVRIGEKTVAEGELNAEQEIQQLNMRTSYSAPYQAIALIEENAEVEDNRARFQ